MKRIIVIGSGGAGKTTLSLQLGEILNIEVFHLDKEFWNAGWVMCSQKMEDAQVKKMISGDFWIIDGNYGRTMVQRIEAADTVIFLDTPRITCLWRAAKRILKYYGKTRPDMADGCPEQIDWEYFVWIWQFRLKNRPAVLRLLNGCRNHKRVITLHSSREIRRFLESVGPVPIS